MFSFGLIYVCWLLFVVVLHVSLRVLCCLFIVVCVAVLCVVVAFVLFGGCCVAFNFR